MERKRPGTHSFHASKAETKTRKKKTKLTLKPPSFITAAQAKPVKKAVRSFDAFLESLLDPELCVEEDVLILLVCFRDETEAGKPEKTLVKDVDQCMGSLEKVYRKYRNRLILNLLFDVLVLLVNTLDGPLPQSVKEFASTTVKDQCKCVRSAKSRLPVNKDFCAHDVFTYIIIIIIIIIILLFYYYYYKVY